MPRLSIFRCTGRVGVRCPSSLAHRIIEPIASRCAKFRFRPFEAQTMLDRLQFVAAQENLQCGPDVFSTVSRLAEGDLRRGITLLQSAARLYSNEVTADAVVDVAGVRFLRFSSRVPLVFLSHC
jgi:DNA polymerase III delta prime subunit